jgi:hypothetical protein
MLGNHDYWEKQINGYIDRELSPADFQAMEQHLSSCQECQVIVQDLTALKKRVKAFAANIETPVALRERLVTALNAAEKRELRKPAQQLWLAIAASVAMFALLGISPVGSAASKYIRGKVTPVHCYHGAIEGTFICPDCEVSRRLGLHEEALCHDGHMLGLMDQQGRLWHFARDTNGLHLMNQYHVLRGQLGVIRGDIIQGQHLVRVQSASLTGANGMVSLEPKDLPLQFSRVYP